MSDWFMVADRPDMRKPPLRSMSFSMSLERTLAASARQSHLFVLREGESVQFVVDRLRSISK
jgi:hypothetical protein